MSSRLALGTAQFGLTYGVANRSGQVAYEDSQRILARARQAGLDTIDTAVGYGESEQRLGSIGVAAWRVISKLPAIPESCPDVARWVDESVESSLRRLRLRRLGGLLLHRPAQLMGERGVELYTALDALKQRGIVDKLGVSIYDPHELDALWPRFALDIVQAPLNLLDRRLASSGWLAKLHAMGVEVHVRSVFLQGLLLMSAAARPGYFNRWSSVWRKLDEWLRDGGASAPAACLAFAAAHPEVARIVVGVDNPAQLEDLLAAASGTAPAPPPDIASDDPDLINPSRWRVH
ncbi:MAG TPA: aldo/keto reductase [Burkholderiales bacterium]|nr:aldo/keto reductase [Burkholderiales bacterium]